MTLAVDEAVRKSYAQLVDSCVANPCTIQLNPIEILHGFERIQSSLAYCSFFEANAL